MKPSDYMAAMKATEIPVGESGLWYVGKISISQPTLVPRDKGLLRNIDPGTYTQLFRWTDATMHLRQGECVMEDTIYELRTHLEFVMRARGRVLVSGLGLGCVVRGLLLNPLVTHVTCLEISPDVLRLVHPHMPTDRLTIVHTEAESWINAQPDGAFDCAWHDVWTDTGAGQEHLQVKHMSLVCAATLKEIPIQGAWQFPRYYRRIMKPECNF